MFVRPTILSFIHKREISTNIVRARGDQTKSEADYLVAIKVMVANNRV